MDARYTDAANEVREITRDGYIDPDAEGAPMVDERIHGILLPLYTHQRLAIHPVLEIEAKGAVKCELPSIRLPNQSLATLAGTPERVIGRFETDAQFILLPVGSGKTLIILSIIALQRVPKRRRVILGVDFAHALLCSTHAELQSFPRQVPAALSLIADNGWYFVNERTAFPSITPKVIDETRVEEKNILPSNVFKIGRASCRERV